MTQASKSNVAELNTDLSQQIAALKDDIANLTATVAEYGRAQGTELKSAATQKAAGVAMSGVATANGVKASAEKTFADTEEAVRANPAAAVGIAAGIGFLVGMLTARR